MDKIYTRKRIRIPKVIINGKNVTSEKEEKLVKIIIVLIIAVLTVNTILEAVNPIFDYMCRDKVKSIATIITNDKATEVIKKHTYDEMFLIEKDLNDNISMVKSNVIAINEITSDVAVKIQEELDKIDREKLEIPLRKFYRA